MSPEKQRIAIAKACPTIFDTKDGYMRYRFDHQKAGMAVDPLNDLNAMHEAEKTIQGLDAFRYTQNLWKVIQPRPSANYDTEKHVCATASQRAEAFLRTLNLWEEE